jgi:hypothetical protein
MIRWNYNELAMNMWRRPEGPGLALSLSYGEEIGRHDGRPW